MCNVISIVPEIASGFKGPRQSSSKPWFVHVPPGQGDPSQSTWVVHAGRTPCVVRFAAQFGTPLESAQLPDPASSDQWETYRSLGTLYQ